MKIVLTGFMGTGKTSVGRELCRKLGYQLVDTDTLIEEREGMPIPLIFKKKGEDYFRKLEQRVAEEVSHMTRSVIATGGGIIKNRKNIVLSKTTNLNVLTTNCFNNALNLCYKNNSIKS